MSDSLIIIPTYNEKENIEKIIRKIFSLEKDFHILVIEDGSPDGEGLSGLASAFFHAGTKSMLVTHWDVETNSAVQLTTGTFDKMKNTKNLSQGIKL